MNAPDEKQSRREGASPSEMTPKPSSKLPKALSFLAPLWDSSRAQKTFFRCWVAILCSFILVVANKSLKVLGNAAFFGVVIGLMVPPSMSVSLFLLAHATLIFGVSVGWAWGAAAMAAALRVRNKVLLRESLQRAQQGISGATNPESEFQIQIFKGTFLDVRSTAVFGVFLAVGTFVLGLIYGNRPKLALFAIFATIIIDILCSYGPLFPFAEYTLAEIILLPLGTYLGIATASIIIIFPETMSHAWMTNVVEGFLNPIQDIAHQHSRLLHSPSLTDPSQNPPSSTDLPPDSRPILKKAVLGLEASLSALPLLELEISYGRFSAKDLRTLEGPMKKLMGSAIGLGTTKFTDVSSDTSRDTPHLQHIRQATVALEEKHGLGMKDLAPLFADGSEEFRNACVEGLESTINVIREFNTRRYPWSRTKGQVKEEGLRFEERKAVLTKLDDALERYNTHGRLMFIQPFEQFFDERGVLKHQFGRGQWSARALFLCMVHSNNLVDFAESVRAFVDQVIQLEAKRTHNRLWFPTGLRKIGNLLKGGKGLDISSTDAAVGAGAGTENPDVIQDIDGAEEPLKKNRNSSVGRRDPDSLPPKNAFQRLTLGIYSFGMWFTKAETIFALKYSLVSVALWLPAVFKTSAYFTYSNRGLWALIAAQTGLAVYAGDQLANLLQKLAGTLFGLVYGMVIWYVGSGDGKGNSYGLAVSLGAFLIPVLALRLHGPPQYLQGCMLFSTTVVLVVGYGYVDSHLHTLANPGWGYRVAWKRALLVIMGMFAAFVVMLFPRPVSSRAFVRRTHATTIEEIGALYATLVEAWISSSKTPELSLSPTNAEVKDSPDTQNRSPYVQAISDHQSRAWSQSERDRFRERTLAVFLKLRGVQAKTETAVFELSLKGEWPKAEYSSLVKTQVLLLEALGQFAKSLKDLDIHWHSAIIQRTSLLNPHLVSDVLATFSLLSNALRTGRALPEATPGPLLDRIFYHERNTRNQPNVDNNDPQKDLHEILPDEYEGIKVGSGPLTLDILQNIEFSNYAVAIVSLFHVLKQLDDLERIVKRLVGETKLDGFEAFQNAWIHRETVSPNV